MSEIHEGVATTEDVGQAQEPAGEGRPEDPSRTSEKSIKAALTSDTSVAAGLDFGPEPPSSTETASEAIAGLTAVVRDQTATTAALTGELAVGEVTGAIGVGVDPAEAIAAGLASGALSKSDAEEISWHAALAEQGLTEEELAEVDDDEFTLSEEIDQRQEQLLAQAKGLANQQDQQRIYQETYSAEFAQGVKNHEASIKAMREYQAELKMDSATFEALLKGVDVELSSGILGQPLDLDQVAIQDPKLFAASLRAAASVILQDLEEQDAQALKQGILAQSRDIADGLVIGGQPVKAQHQPVFNEERYIDRVAKRSKKGPFDGPVNLPAERSIRAGFTLDGRKIAMDDIPTGDDGLTARQRHRESQRRGGRAS